MKTVENGGRGPMIWGCMGSAGVGRMEFIEGTMNHKMYIDTFKRNMGRSADRLDIVASRVVES